MSRFLKISLVTGLATAGVIVLYQVSNLLLIYHYFTYEYYIAGVAIVALGTGFMLAARYRKTDTTVGAGRLDSLTARELRVLELISQGRSNKEIAALNYVELSTVKTHINNIYCKLGVKNRKDAAAIYQKNHTSQKSTLSPPAII
jgi:DNA-binding CsgD family transcriptional regulator